MVIRPGLEPGTQWLKAAFDQSIARTQRAISPDFTWLAANIRIKLLIDSEFK